MRQNKNKPSQISVQKAKTPLGRYGHGESVPMELEYHQLKPSENWAESTHRRVCAVHLWYGTGFRGREPGSTLRGHRAGTEKAGNGQRVDIYLREEVRAYGSWFSNFLDFGKPAIEHQNYFLKKSVYINKFKRKVNGSGSWLCPWSALLCKHCNQSSDSQDPHNKSGIAVYFCNPSTRDAEYGDLWSLLASQ